MKKFLFLGIVISLVSCKSMSVPDRTDLRDILSYCSGHVIVMAVGYNEGNFESCRYTYMLRDDSMNCFEFVGAKYPFAKGDTIR